MPLSSKAKTHVRHHGYTSISVTSILEPYVHNAQATVEEEVSLPEGYSLVWSGQFEHMERSQDRLRIVIPLTLIIIFLLLFLNFKNVTESLIVMLSLPFSVIGGIWLIYLLDYDVSIAVFIGFLALAGVAVEIALIMLTYLDQEFNSRVAKGEMTGLSDLREVVIMGTSQRLRPIVMTVTTVIVGLLPIMWGSGTGIQVMKRIAAPMVGGMISTTILSLLVIPAIYFLWRSIEVRRKNREVISA